MRSSRPDLSSAPLLCHWIVMSSDCIHRNSLCIGGSTHGRHGPAVAAVSHGAALAEQITNSFDSLPDPVLTRAASGRWRLDLRAPESLHAPGLDPMGTARAQRRTERADTAKAGGRPEAWQNAGLRRVEAPIVRSKRTLSTLRTHPSRHPGPIPHWDYVGAGSRGGVLATDPEPAKGAS